MALLFDTNIFLEVLLDQSKQKECKNLIAKEIHNINISDFTLHSIGVILTKQEKIDILEKFLNDILPVANIVTLSKSSYLSVISICRIYSLDFDDAYQAAVANENSLTILTMDNDFLRAKDFVQIRTV